MAIEPKNVEEIILLLNNKFKFELYQTNKYQDFLQQEVYPKLYESIKDNLRKKGFEINSMKADEHIEHLS